MQVLTMKKVVGHDLADEDVVGCVSRIVSKMITYFLDWLGG